MQALERSREQVYGLKEEVLASDRTKGIAMDMLSEERREKYILQQKLEGYKEELKKSYKVILDLKKMIGGVGTL